MNESSPEASHDSGSALTVPNRLSADRPIESPKQDLLNRGPMSESLAMAIGEWHGRDSLVLSLQGAWGSGKTSAKNLTIAKLGDTVHVLEFNPWQWRGHDAISAAFFRELGTRLGQSEDRSEERAARWEEYVALLRVGTSVARGARLVATIAWVLAAAFIGLSFTADSSVGNPIGWITAVAVFVAGLLTASEQIAEAIASLFRHRGRTRTRPLQDLKHTVGESLRDLDRPVLVVIDDIDRLTPPETAEVFQLVKANADFPNLVYLLLFDQTAVSQGLNQLTSHRGAQFIEKIVQIAFQLPQPDRHQIQTVLLTRLDAILDRATHTEVQADRWWPLFEQGLWPFFDNLRDVYRFLAALEFDLALVSKDGALEVNPIDMVGIEALRIFEPGIYGGLPALKPWIAPDLYALRATLTNRETVRERARTGLDALTEGVSAAHRNRVRLLLRALFPYYAADERAQPEGSLDEWLRDLRVCHHRLFDRYFQYSVPSGDVSEIQVRALISGGRDATQLTHALESLADQGLLEVTLDHLHARREEIRLSRSVDLMTALFNLGERIERNLHGPLGPRPLFDAESVIESLLARTEAGQRGVQLGEAMRASTGLYLPANVLHNETNRRNDRRPGQDEPLLSEPELDGACAVLAQQIADAASADQLMANPRFAYIFVRWMDVAPDEARRWAQKVAASDDDLLTILNALLRREPDARSSGWLYYFDLKMLESLFEMPFLETRAEELRGHRISSEALDALDRALAQRRELSQDNDG